MYRTVKDECSLVSAEIIIICQNVSTPVLRLTSLSTDSLLTFGLRPVCGHVTAVSGQDCDLRQFSLWHVVDLLSFSLSFTERVSQHVCLCVRTCSFEGLRGQPALPCRVVHLSVAVSGATKRSLVGKILHHTSNTQRRTHHIYSSSHTNEQANEIKK